MISVISPLPRLPVHQLFGSKWWLLLADYTLPVLIDGAEFVLTIPAGYRYDRGSVPDAVAWIVSKDDLGCAGPLVHDALYVNEGIVGSVMTADYPACIPWRSFTRAETDELFHAVMLADKVSSWRARLAWAAVRLFARRW